MGNRYTAADVAGMTGTTVNQIEHLVQIGAVAPAQPALRRGMSRGYDVWNIAEIMAGVELIDADVPGDLVVVAVTKIRDQEYRAKLANPSTRNQVAILGLTRLSGYKSKPPLAMFFPPTAIGEICDAGYTIIAAVSIGYIMRTIEKFTRETFA